MNEYKKTTDPSVDKDDDGEVDDEEFENYLRKIKKLEYFGGGGDDDDEEDDLDLDESFDFAGQTNPIQEEEEKEENDDQMDFSHLDDEQGSDFEEMSEVEVSFFIT